MWNRTEDQVRFVFIRHGKTKANREHRYLGRTDESLSREGLRELLAYKEEGRYPKTDALFVSPMKRCRETAKILYPNSRFTVITEWEEIDFGAFEYKNHKELAGDARYQAWINSDGALPFPEGESREHFRLRCEKGFESMLKKLQGIPLENFEGTAKVGLIVHGGTIMALLSRFCRGDYFDYQVSNGRGYICRISGWKDGNYQAEEVRGI